MPGGTSSTHDIQYGLAFSPCKEFPVDQQHLLGGIGVLGVKEGYEENRKPWKVPGRKVILVIEQNGHVKRIGELRVLRKKGL